MEAFEQTSEALNLARRCYPILAGQPAVTQSSALCELVARHLAGHVVVGNASATAELRAQLLAAMVHAIEQLTPVIDAEVIQPQVSRMRQ